MSKRKKKPGARGKSTKRQAAARKIDPTNLATRFRADAEGFVGCVIGHYERVAPKITARHLVAIEYHLREALKDACALDESAVACGHESNFLRGFMESVFCDRGFFRALCAVAQMRPDKKASRPIADAMKKGEDPTAAFILYRFRERLKVGASAENALRWYGEEIGRELAKGNLWLLERLAEAAREVFKPSRQRLIIRAWLPLALWQKVAVEEKERRLHDAWKVEKAGGTLLPDWPGRSIEKPYRIEAMIRAARAAIHTRAHRKP